MPHRPGHTGGLLSGPPVTTPENVISDSPLDRLFTGLFDPRLSPEENERIRRTALTRAGLAGLISLRQPGGLLGTVGRAGAAGQATREELTESLLPETPEVETQVITRADGSTALINKLTGLVIRELGPAKEKPPQEFEAPKEVVTASGERVLGVWDPRKRMYTTLDGAPIPGAQPIPKDPERGVTVQEMDPETGRIFEYFADPTTGRQIGPRRLADIETLDEGGDPVVAAQIEREVENMEAILGRRGDRPFGPVETLLSKSDFTRGLTSEDNQQFQAAAKNVVSFIILSRSGKQASIQEQIRLEAFAVPLPGETPATVRAKMERLRLIVQDMRRGKDPFDRVRGAGAGEEGNQMEHLIPRGDN